MRIMLPDGIFVHLLALTVPLVSTSLCEPVVPPTDGQDCQPELSSQAQLILSRSLRGGFVHDVPMQVFHFTLVGRISLNLSVV